MKVFGAVVSIVVVVMFGTYMNARSGFVPLDDEARTNASGQFVNLSDGRVHYQWLGADAEESVGPAVVFVHGFSTPSYVWAGLLEPFTKAKRRILVYDNFGRGYSDRPEVANDAGLFDRQLLELLDSQGVKDPVDLVGYSMGGAIVTYFAANHPEKVRRLGMIAPAGFPVNTGSTAGLMVAPLLGDWLMAVFGRQVMLDTMSAPENQGRAIPDIAARYEVQMQYEGYFRSLLSTLRHYPMGNLEDEFQRVGTSKIPSLAIWGDQDSVVPPTNAALLGDAVPQAVFETIEGGTHAITYSEPERVSAALISFFADSETANRQRPSPQ